MKLLDSLALLAYCGLIYFLSNQPMLPVPELFSWQDKIEHFSAYALMAVLAWRCFRHYVMTLPLLAFISFMFCSVHGGLDEWHQSFVVGRVSDIADWLADSIGALVAVMLLLQQSKRFSSSAVQE